MVAETILTAIPTLILNRNNMDIESYLVVIVGFFIIMLTFFYVIFTNRHNKNKSRITEEISDLETMKDLDIAIIHRKIDAIYNNIVFKKTLPKQIKFSDLEKKLTKNLDRYRNEKWQEIEGRTIFNETKDTD
jgi:hypothetical protein